MDELIKKILGMSDYEITVGGTLDGNSIACYLSSGAVDHISINKCTVVERAILLFNVKNESQQTAITICEAILKELTSQTSYGSTDEYQIMDIFETSGINYVDRDATAWIYAFAVDVFYYRKEK